MPSSTTLKLMAPSQSTPQESEARLLADRLCWRWSTHRNMRHALSVTVSAQSTFCSPCWTNSLVILEISLSHKRLIARCCAQRFCAWSNLALSSIGQNGARRTVHEICTTYEGHTQTETETEARPACRHLVQCGRAWLAARH